MELGVECPTFQDLPVQERLSLREMYSLFLGDDVDTVPEQVPPSCFLREMSMTTEQRYQKLVSPQLNSKYEKMFGVDNVFRLLPRVLIFQNFEPGDTYTVTVSIQNASKVLSPLHMVCSDSPNFQITYKSPDIVTRLAPGLSVVFDVKFMPDKARDYEHKITFFTEFSRFNLPIYVIGPRPLLDFPDSVCIPSTAVKISSSRHVLIRNIGKIPAVFVLSTERPFIVCPKRAVLPVGELMQVVISLNSSTAGSFNCLLQVTYETGEKLAVHLQGKAENENIVLDRDIVNFKDTFIGLKRQDIVTLFNNSSHVIQFKWLSKPPEDRVIQSSESEESECEEDDLTHQNFTLIPQSGEVWPSGSVDTTLIFEPTCSTMYEAFAYCKVTGRELFMVLTMTGCGLGPNIMLNLESLDISFVLLGSVHNYEVICANNGDITGTITYVSKALLFGGEVQCSPASYKLAPGEHRAFVLTFSSSHAGDFTEKITFLIEESREEIMFTLKGRVISPTLNFTTSELNFGEIPIGFVSEGSVTMCNTSLVPVKYSMMVKSDGKQSSVTYEEYARMGADKKIPVNPKEFIIEPAESVVEPASCIPVKLTVIPNIARHHTTSIMVKIRNSEDDPLCLPLRYIATYPHIFAEPSDITLDYCFINLPYEKTLTLVNDHTVIGYFYIVPQKVDANNPLTYSLAINESVIKPKSRVTIPVTIMTNELGFHSAVIKLLVMGVPEPVDLCRVACMGQGPVVILEPDRLHWGTIPLLVLSVRSFSLTNDSPIPASFHIIIDKRYGRWVATPDQGVVNPKEVLIVDVGVFLTDSGNFSARLNVHIANSRTLVVRMHVQGEGTSIVTDPPISPEFNLGTVFSEQCVECQLVVKNEGTKHHQLHWSFSPDTSRSGRLQTAVSKESHFEILPMRMSLLPGDQAVLTIKARSERAEVVGEELYCSAVIEYTGKPQPIFIASIVANFVDPLVVFSKPHLIFCCDILEDEPKVLQEAVQLTNQSILPLTVVLHMDHPFQIATGDGDSYTCTTIHLEGLSTIELIICFNTAFSDDRYCKSVEGFVHVCFEEHPQKVKFPLRGEINFPNVKVKSEIDFGCILVGTNTCREILLQNVSPLPVIYSWSWVLNSSDISITKNEQETGEDPSSACLPTLLEPCKHLVNAKLADDDNSTEIVDCNVCLKCWLFHLVAPFFVEVHDTETLEMLPVKTEVLPVLKYFELTPHRGHLKPYESTPVWMTFFGFNPVTVNIQAKCSVKGGPVETITVNAMASCVSYHLSKLHIDFGKQVLFKECTDIIVLHNTGNMPFDFVVQYSRRNSNLLDSKIIVEPMSGHLLGGSNIHLTVTFVPGASEKFVGKFFLEIAYLNPVTVSVEGFGSIPQLYVNLPRPALLDLPAEIGYEAISNIENDLHPLVNIAEEYECVPEDKRIMFDWVFLCEKDRFPSVADIELAVERMIAYNYLVNNPSIVLHYASLKNTKALPELYVPPYTLDVGAVVPGTEVSYSVLVTNYAPTNLYARLEKMEQHNCLKDYGFQVELSHQQIPVNGSAELLFVLKPSIKSFTSKRTDFIISVSIEVAGGAKIGITVKGFITVPFVTVIPDMVCFKTLKNGFCRKMAVIVKNESWLPCVWKAELKSKISASKKKHFETHRDDITAFSINSSEKCFKPNDAEFLEIFFTPVKPGDYKVYLVFTMHQNPVQLVVLLQGEAVEPQLTISNLEIIFPPCLPYQQCEEQHFTIKNPCAFSVEVFLPYLDRQFHEEERVLNVLFNLYDSEMLLLPDRTPGDKLPQELLDFYHCVSKRVRSNLMNKEGTLKPTKNSEEDEKVKKKLKKKVSSLVTAVASTTTVDPIVHSPPEDPFYSKHQEEIDLLINECLNEMKMTGDFGTCGSDPVQKVFAGAQPEFSALEKDATREGVLVIYHGAPLTESMHAAHKTGKTLGLSVQSIDQILIEEILYSNTVVGKKVHDFINAAYFEELEKFDVSQNTDFQQMDEYFEDAEPMEELLSKVIYLNKIYLEKTKKANESVVKVTRKRKSAQASRASSSSPPSSQRAAKVPSNRRLFQSLDPSREDATFANIPQDMLTELIAQRFQMPVLSQGFVIESLESIFLPSPLLALASLLTAARNTSHVFCVIVNYSLDNHYKWLAENKHREELAKAAEHKTKVEMFENLDDSEIEELGPDDRLLYEQIELNKRKQLIKLRFEERQMRHLEKLEKQRQQSLKKLKDKGKKSKKKAGKVSAGESGKRVAGRSNVVGIDSLAEPVSVNTNPPPSREGSRKLQRRRSSTSSKVPVQTDQDIEADVDIYVESELTLAFESFQRDLFEIITLVQNWDKQKGTVVDTVPGRIVSPTPTKKLQKNKQHTVELQLPRQLSRPVSEQDDPLEVSKDHGIPLWVVNCTGPNVPQLDTFVKVIIDNMGLQKLLAHLRRPRELAPPETVTYLNVVHRELRQKSDFCSVFPLSPVDDQSFLDVLHTAEESDDSIKSTSELGTVKKSKKGKLKSISKLDVSLASLSTQNINNISEDCSKFKTRWILSPGESVDWRMTFEPKQVGKYSHSYTMEVTGWNRQHCVTGHGVCGIPEINTCPHVIFPHVSESAQQERYFSPVYVIENETFDLGSAIISKPKDKNIHQVTADLTFENVGLLPATIYFSFLDSVTDKVDSFSFEPNIISVEPGGRETMKVMATPRLLGISSEMLVCSIKNNPKIHLIKIICNGAKIEFEVDMKSVSFEPSLLHHKDIKVVTLKNKSPVSLLWRFFGNESLKNDFEVSTTEGVIMPYDSQEIHITYTALKIQTITKKPVKIEVFLDKMHREPVLSEVIHLSAETYDVIVDVQFPHPDDDHLNFGGFLVGHEQQKVLVLRNKGKYDIFFTLTLNKEALEKIRKLKNIIVINPDSGMLVHSEKPFSIQVTVNPQEELQINKIPAFTLTILQNMDTVVAIIPIHLSLSAAYAKFRIEPLPEINFGPMLVTTKKSLFLSIENTGSYELKYSIIAANSVITDQSHDGLDKVKDTKKTTGKKGMERKDLKPSSSKVLGKFNRSDSNRLTAGVFLVSSPSGVVTPSETVQLPVECILEAEGHFHKVIMVHISGSSPKFKDGVPVQLVAQGYLPTIDFTNIDNIFREHYICESLDKFEQQNAEVGSHCVFSKDNETLWFCNVCVGTSFAARLRLHNPGLVSSHLFVSAESDVFSVTPEELTILPQSTEMITVTFAPLQLESYSSKLEIVIEMPSTLKSVKIVFSLRGESCIPEVKITSPNHKTSDGHTLVMFEPTLLGQVHCHQFTLCNTGVLPCKVFMEFSKIRGNIFSVYPTKDAMCNVLLLIKNEPIQNTTVVSLNPGKSAAFDVHFQPREPGVFDAVLKLYIVGNPFENLRVVLRGHCFQEDVTFEGLNIEPLANCENELSRVQSFHLNLGHCYINRTHTVNFKITNHSGMSAYRFEWKPNQNVRIMPDVGHLAPNTVTNSVLCFTASEPLFLHKVEVECLVAKIIVLDKYKLSSWNSEQMVANWSRNVGRSFCSESSQGLRNSSSSEVHFNSFENCEGQNVVFLRDEPKHEVITGSTRPIVLLVSVTADFAKCSCSMEEILFKDTLMFKNRTFRLELTNTGIVLLEYEWIVMVEDCLYVLCSSATMLQNINPRPLPAPRPHSAVCIRSRPHSARKIARPLTGREPLVDTTMSRKVQSSEALASTRSSSSWIGDEYIPFTVDPDKGTLSPGQKVEVRVTFSPFDTHDYRGKLKCIIPNSDPDERPIEVMVRARSLMPYCHLEVEESDYLSSGRRDPTLPSPVIPLDRDTKTIEFRVMGVGATCIKEFYVVNPTEQNFTFVWHKDFPSSENLVESISCHTKNGFIEKGKKKQVSFSFVSPEIGVFESFWTLTIPEFDVHTLFLLVGIATEPLVYFLNAHVNLKPTVKGVKTQTCLSLVNNEDIGLTFEFTNESLFSEECTEKLNVEPFSGVLTPKSEQKISVTYVPEISGESLFSLKCNVEKMKKPLEISVLGTCYSIQPLVSWEDVDGKKHKLRLTADNILDFKEVSSRQATNITFRIVNSGKISFSYQFSYDEDKLRRLGFRLKFSNKGGCVISQNCVAATMSCTALKDDVVLHDFEVNLVISQGPTYRMLVRGKAIYLHFQFSFTKFNFGPCIIKNPQKHSYKKELIFTNKEEKCSLLLECKYENKPHLEVSMKSCPVPPGQSLTIYIIFNPCEINKYDETVVFLINGSLQKEIQISGEGTEMKVLLVNNHHRIIELGALQVGQFVSKHIPVVNKSKVPVKINFSFEDPPTDLAKVLKIVPNDCITIQPEEVIKMSIIFNPGKMMKPFSQKIVKQFNKHNEPLCMVKGSCIGYEFVLDRTYLLFGAVVEGCSSKLKLVLSNVGDLGSKFSWQRAVYDDYFTITPVTGYCSPGCAVTFTVCFHPRQQMQNIRSEVQCEIENHKSLSVVLSGSCVSMPPVKEVINFSCAVQQQDTKNVTVSNKTSETWQLHPQISGDFFSGADILIVKPHTAEHYEVIYAPLTVMHETVHSGSILFCLPNGEALVYSLQGTVQPPQPKAKITREIHSKTEHKELLPVTNWLQQPQRFTVTTMLLKSEKYDPVFTVTGNDYIDVPGNSTRDYKLIFNVNRECIISFKVTFTNKTTGDFQFYELTLKVGKCGPLMTIKMRTFVRVPTTNKLSLKNPLPQDVNYTIACSAPDVTFPAHISVPAKSVKHVLLEYLPLQPGDGLWSLDATCSELGLFPYELQLEAIPAPEEKPVIFTTNLGSSANIHISVHNYSLAKAEFACIVNHSDFQTENNIIALASSAVSVKITYEPSSLGSSSAILTVMSPTAGEYIFPLIGKCSPPKPQGPMELKPGTGTAVLFKNVFNSPQTFNIAVDNPAFVLKNLSETIKSKKETKIHVGLQPVKHLNIKDTRMPVTGKLTVICSDPIHSHIVWTYYLKGILD